MPVRGVVRSTAQAAISTDIVALITRIGFREGEKFSKGDLLVALDCRRLHAELASAEAHYQEMKVAFRSAAYLYRRNAGNRNDMQIAKARSDRTRATADAIRAQTEQCTISAPFAGRIAELGIHEHEMSVAGKPLLSIVAERDSEIELIVPSAWLTWLEPGIRFRFRIDETKTDHTGEVARLGAAVDTVSQTIKVFAKFSSHAPGILPGMSGTALSPSRSRGGIHE
jgi:RND family efflux transporter MFP subunit